MAQWWAEFNRDGDDIACFQKIIEENGEPALDLGCGTGRLLLPFLRAGLDVEGCDLSPDMIDLCRQQAEAEGLVARLHTQATHELDLARRFRTIVACGSFGLGGDRRQDLEGLRLVCRHLEPGGLLALDHYLPNSEPLSWSAWLPKHRPEFPMPWPDKGDRRRASDGSELELRARVAAFDPLEQTVVREMRIERWRDGKRVTREENAIRINLYFKSEVVLMLEAAGFEEIQVRGGLEDRPARPYDDVRLMFLARKGREER
jgi:SAM-dependent methyltransferase